MGKPPGKGRGMHAGESSQFSFRELIPIEERANVLLTIIMMASY